MSDFLHDPEIDRLVRELNRERAESAGRAPRDEATEMLSGPLELPRLAEMAAVDQGDPLEKLLTQMARRGASDLLLIPKAPPAFRVHGSLVASDLPPLDGDDLKALFAPYLGGRIRAQLDQHGAADFSLRLGAAVDGSGGWRFRVNLHRQRGELAAALRVLPREVPSLEGLNLPLALARLVQPARGLVLICGPTGAGKSSTLAALLAEINGTRAAHIVTIEDPVEYEHGNVRSIIEQVEVGIDAPSFASALRAALRQDPDVILVGEMRDLETVATALTAAETGHLILSTLHTSDVVQAVHRIVDVFPPEQQSQIRQQLALSLSAIVCQQLLPRADGTGRVPAVEILTATYPVRHHIRTQSLQKLYNEITQGKAHGMVSFEESLARLVRSGAVSIEEARVRTTRPEMLESLLQSL